MSNKKPIDFIRIPILEIMHKISPNHSAINKKLLKIYADNLLLDKGMKLYDDIVSYEYSPTNSSINFFSQLKQIEKHHVRFYNFWPANHVLDYWLYDFLLYRDLHEERLNFFSVFGSKDMISIKNDAPRVFFSGENVYFEQYKKQGYADYCLGCADLSMGFEYIDAPNYLRLPLWIMVLIPAHANYETIKTIIAQLNNLKLRNLGRSKFTSIIAGHRAMDGGVDREKMTHLFEQIAHVECAGKLLKNTNDLQEKFADNKLLYLQQFKFNLCPENSACHGYVTEKLFDAIRAGCIPVYWGDDNPEPGILNHDAIIFYDLNNPQTALDKVSELWQNDHLYQEFCHIPPFKSEAVDKIWETLQELERKIRALVE